MPAFHPNMLSDEDIDEIVCHVAGTAPDFWTTDTIRRVIVAGANQMHRQVIQPSGQFVQMCGRIAVRSSLFRRSNPEKKYANNHEIPLEMRVPPCDQRAEDWEEFDPNA